MPNGHNYPDELGLKLVLFARILVGVDFERQLAESTGDVFFYRAADHAQLEVVISDLGNEHLGLLIDEGLTTGGQMQKGGVQLDRGGGITIMYNNYSVCGKYNWQSQKKFEELVVGSHK